MARQSEKRVLSWLKYEVQIRNIPQKKVGEAAGWDEDQTSKVMHGKRDVKADELLGIIDFFGYPNPCNQRGETDVQRIARIAGRIDEPRRRALAEFLESVL